MLYWGLGKIQPQEDSRSCQADKLRWEMVGYWSLKESNFEIRYKQCKGIRTANKSLRFNIFYIWKEYIRDP